MELNVGDYVRTKYGHIGKIIDINLGDFQTRYELDNNDEFHYEYKDDIIKSSPNIIDLIEERDYINGIPLDEGELNFYKKYPEYIGSVVTREQFEQMKYKVRD